MRDVPELEGDLLEMDHRTAKVLKAIIPQDMLHPKALFLIKGQHPIIEHMHRGFRELEGVKLLKQNEPYASTTACRYTLPMA